MSDSVLSLDQLDTYADQLRQQAPTLREEAAALPPELDGSPALSRQYAELMRHFGATNEELAKRLEEFTNLCRSHLEQTPHTTAGKDV